MPPHDCKFWIYAWEQAMKFSGTFDEVHARAWRLYRSITGTPVPVALH